MGLCNRCNCSPCSCRPAALANPQIIGGVLDGPTINGPTINGGQALGVNIVGATLDCTTRGCTQPNGVCNDSLATTAFVCQAIDAAISPLNPQFCFAVQECIAAGLANCDPIAQCINTTPGIINTTNAFGPGSHASTTQFGVVAEATRDQIDQLNCNVVITPCGLAELFCAPNTISPFWNCFTNAVNVALFGIGGDICTATAVCGYAPLSSPAFVGIPTAPTAAPGTFTNQIATTEFVGTAIATALAGDIFTGNPAFCGAVNACIGGGGGSGGGRFASFAVDCLFGSISGVNFSAVAPFTNSVVSQVGCTVSFAGLDGGFFQAYLFNVVFNTPQTDINYQILFESNDAPYHAAWGWPGDAGNAYTVINKTVNGFTFSTGTEPDTCGGAACSGLVRFNVALV